jgi:hypothetical protein
VFFWEITIIRFQEISHWKKKMKTTKILVIAVFAVMAVALVATVAVSTVLADSNDTAPTSTGEDELVSTPIPEETVPTYYCCNGAYYESYNCTFGCHNGTYCDYYNGTCDAFNGDYGCGGYMGRGHGGYYGCTYGITP